MKRCLRATSTPSTRRLLDGVAVSVPHHSTEPARPRHYWLISTQARRHPRVRAVSYEALMEARDPEVVRGLFEFIGLPDFWPDFSGQALKAKRPRCHLCDFHDARVALTTTAPTPEPVYSNGTTATRSRARRHPEGTLFLGFLLALLVLVAVLGAPCRRSLGDAVLLPDEEDM